MASTAINNDKLGGFFLFLMHRAVGWNLCLPAQAAIPLSTWTAVAETIDVTV